MTELAEHGVHPITLLGKKRRCLARLNGLETKPNKDNYGLVYGPHIALDMRSFIGRSQTVAIGFSESWFWVVAGATCAARPQTGSTATSSLRRRSMENDGHGQQQSTTLDSTLR